MVWCWGNLNVHLAGELGEFADANQDWLRVHFAAADLGHLARVTKRKLKKIQYRPHLVTGCLTTTGLTLEAPDSTNST